MNLIERNTVLYITCVQMSPLKWRHLGSVLKNKICMGGYLLIFAYYKFRPIDLSEKFVKFMRFTLPVVYPVICIPFLMSEKVVVYVTTSLRHCHWFDYIRGAAHSQVTFLFSLCHEFRPHTSNRNRMYLYLIWVCIDCFDWLIGF